jgi:hypothetical protein
VLVLVAGAGLLLRVLVNDGLEVMERQASAAEVMLTAAGTATGLGAWALRRRREAALPATPDRVDEAAAALAGAVREQWQEEAKARSLGDPEPMPVRWRLTRPDLMDDPVVIVPGAPLVFEGSSDRIGPLAEVFRALPRRRLVITGGPGTGKTTLAVQLILELIPPPGQPPTEPVPVLFSLASWTPETQPRVQDWLTGQLQQTYPALRAIDPDAARALVEQGRVLPVLDGLDEVSPIRRAGIITALNASLAPDGGLILTSRPAEYRTALTAAGDVLTAAALIGPLALTRTESAEFLRRHLPINRHPDWNNVLEALTTGRAPNLAAVTATPLGLWLVRTVYCDNHCSPMSLIDTTFPAPGALRSRLLDELIPAVIRARPPLTRRLHDAPDAALRPARQHRPENMRRWLTTLAQQLAATASHPRASDWLWWELYRYTFPTRRHRMTFAIQSGVVSGLVGSLVGLLIAGQDGPEGGLLGLMTSGLILGLVLALFLGLMNELARGWTLTPRHANLRLSGRTPELVRRLVGGLAGGLVFGPVFGLALGLAFWLAGLVFDQEAEQLEPESWLLGGLFIGALLGLVSGLMVGLAKFVGSSDVAGRSASPTRSYRGDRAHSVITALVAGLTGGLIMAGLLGIRDYGRVDGDTLLFVMGLGILTLLTIVLLSIDRAWQYFDTAAIRQAISRRLPPPWQLMAVLDDAHKLGLLRVVGPAYQFRHAELQEHLTSSRPPDRSVAQPT